MPRELRLDLVHKAISAGRIVWKDACVERFRNDPEMKRFTEYGLKQDLKKFINRGNNCRPQKELETSDWWDERDPYWYHVTLPTPIFRLGLFVKMKLLWEDGEREDEAFVEIVNVHEEKK